MTMDERRIPDGLERRVEDARLITGRGGYVDDLRPPAGRPDALIMAVVRSPYAHARVGDIQTEAARAVPGVVAVHSGRELGSALPPIANVPLPDPNAHAPERRALATDTVRYVGDPLAVVLAENRYAAADARDLVAVDYEPLPAVTDAEAALESDAPLLYPELGTNQVYRLSAGGGDIAAAFAQAAGVARLRLVNQRLAATPMEPRACMFDFDPATGRLTAWISSQSVYQAAVTLARVLNLDPANVRAINADVGGGFGTKTGFLGEELVAAALAVRYGRPVKWIEERSENLQAQMHGRGQTNYIEAAYTADGEVLGLRVRTIADLGAFLYGVGPLLPAFTMQMLGGPYRIRAVEAQVVGALTDKPPTAPYRGAGRPEAAYILERTMDRIASALNLDPVELRRRNLLPPDVFPYHSPTGYTYDSGNYQAALDKALARVDYAGWRERQRERRAHGDPRLLGIGLSTYIETTGGLFARPDAPQEAATVRIQPDGTILVQSGVAHNGQGHFTAFSQIAAQVFGVSGTHVQVLMNDSALPAYGLGTNASRITQIAGSAVLLAAEAARDKAVKVAADVLEAAPDDLEVAGGRIAVRGLPSRGVDLGEIARLVEARPELIEREPPNPINGVPIEGLAAWRSFTPTGPGISSGAHIAVVEVDGETGETRILRYVAVDDSGRILNPYLAEMQMHGALAQGIGQALYEEVRYDPAGPILSGTLLDYAVPKASQLPTFELDVVETPSPINPLGAKGVGEAGTIGAPPAIVNAVLDALAPLGITTIDMPLQPEKVWALIQAARAGTLAQAAPTPPAAFSSAPQP